MAKDSRQIIGLACSVCKSRNYITQKNALETKDKLILKKYCKICRVVREHQEVKLK